MLSRGAWWHSPLVSEPGLQVFPQCGLCVFFCCGWAVIAAGMLFGRVGPQVGWLRGLHVIAVSLWKRGTGPHCDWLWSLAMAVVNMLWSRADPLEQQLLWRGHWCWQRTLAGLGGLGAALERPSGMGVLSRREHLGRTPGREHLFNQDDGK